MVQSLARKRIIPVRRVQPLCSKRSCESTSLGCSYVCTESNAMEKQEPRLANPSRSVRKDVIVNLGSIAS